MLNNPSLAVIQSPGNKHAVLAFKQGVTILNLLTITYLALHKL